MNSLTFILLCPLIGALLIVLLPRTWVVLFRLIALGTTLLSLAGSIWLFAAFVPGAAGIQFEEYVPWVRSVGIGYHVGVDGLNVGMILMAAIVAFAAVCMAREIRTSEKMFYVLLLVMAGGILGAFASLDLFLFYFFHELALIPTFIMIGVWGRGENRNYATFKVTLYLSVGAMIALAGLIALVIAAGGRTFDMVQLSREVAANPLAPGAQRCIFALLLLGFGILVSLWPFHTWAPLGYAAAPTPTAMLHAGVLKKFGLYGLVRVALPLLPEGAREWLPVVAVLAMGNLVYGGLVAMRQRNLNLLLGNSSVAHMGFVFLGIASLSLVGLTGAVVIMIAHGLLAALSFALSGCLLQRLGTLEMPQMGGLLQRMPFLGTVLVMALLAGCGLPGFANFPGEVMVLFGAWEGYPRVVVFAAWAGLILGGVYALRAIRQVLHGPLPGRWAGVTDALNAWRKLGYALPLAALIVFGCCPSLLTDRIEASARQVLAAVMKSAGGAPVAAIGAEGRPAAVWRSGNGWAPGSSTPGVAPR